MNYQQLPLTERDKVMIKRGRDELKAELLTWLDRGNAPDVLSILFNHAETSGCHCERCEKEFAEKKGIPFIPVRMILCPTCGNKRCPKATDHRNECTGSNEPGQPGSSWIKEPDHGQE